MSSQLTIEVFVDKRGEYRWRIRHQNGQIIATSGEGYKRKNDCMVAINSMRLNAAEATIKML